VHLPNTSTSRPQRWRMYTASQCLLPPLPLSLEDCHPRRFLLLVLPLLRSKPYTLAECPPALYNYTPSSQVCSCPPAWPEHRYARWTWPSAPFWTGLARWSGRTGCCPSTPSCAWILRMCASHPAPVRGSGERKRRACLFPRMCSAPSSPVCPLKRKRGMWQGDVSNDHQGSGWRLIYLLLRRNVHVLIRCLLCLCWILLVVHFSLQISQWINFCLYIDIKSVNLLHLLD